MLNNKTFQRAYLIGAVIVWVGIIVASAITLSGTPYLAQMLPILGGGAFFWTRQRSEHPLPTGKHDTNVGEERQSDRVSEFLTRI